MAQQISEIHAMLTQLTAEWARFRPIADAFSRGGMLAARTAAKHQRRGGYTDSSYTDRGGPHHD